MYTKTSDDATAEIEWTRWSWWCKRRQKNNNKEEEAEKRRGDDDDEGNYDEEKRKTDAETNALPKISKA